MWWLLPSSWHLVNCKNAEAHAWSSATLHLGQCEVPERIGSSTHELSSFCCCQKNLQQLHLLQWGVGNMEHLLKNQAVWSIFWKIRLLYPMYVCRLGNFGQSALLFFICSHLVSCNQQDCAIKGGVQLHKPAHICARATTGGNTWMPPLPASLFNTICGFFKLQMGCDF